MGLREHSSNIPAMKKEKQPKSKRKKLSEELLKLQTLLSDGAISQEEFDRLKERLED